MVASSLTVPGDLGRLTTDPHGRAALLQQLRQSCHPRAGAAKIPAISMGLPEVDAILPGRGLDPAGLHEWIGLAEAADPTLQATPPSPRSRKRNLARESRPGDLPLLILCHLARQALAAEREWGAGDRLVWIGQAVWPYAPALIATAGEKALASSIFIRAAHPAARVWATDLVLRSRTAAAVIVDGTGFDLAATRRLQLAAEAGAAGGGTLCLVARPPEERAELSAATTRWLVRSSPSLSGQIRWTLELLRCKGMRPTPTQPLWTLEHATRTLSVVPDTLDRPGAKEAESPRRSTG